MHRRLADIDPLTPLEAYRLLGLSGSGSLSDARRAFREAVKTSRPDQGGGDPERFRRVIAAWRLIQQDVRSRTPDLLLPAEKSRVSVDQAPVAARPKAATAPVSPKPAPPAPEVAPPVELGPLDLAKGARKQVVVGGKRFRITCPPGLRDGERIRLKGAGRDGADLLLPIVVRSSEAHALIGDDLHMTSPVSHRVLADGGRVEINTPFGVRSAWVTPGLQAPVRLRLRGLGLPARGERLAGHLFVTLEPVEDAPSAAEHLLAKFTRVWTPERLAA